MYSPETAQYVPPAETGQALPETHIEVDLGKLKIDSEKITNNWNLLDDLNAAATDDAKLEMIHSLSVSDKDFDAQASEAIRNKTVNLSNFKKSGHIYVLRKMLLGHDWRAADVAEQAYNYIRQKIEKVKSNIESLSKKQTNDARLNDKISLTIINLRMRLKELEDDQKKLAEVISEGYAKLWEKISNQANPEANGSNQPAAPEATPAAPGATIIKKEVAADAAIENAAENAAKLETLTAALQELLNDRKGKSSAEIAKFLLDNGFDVARQQVKSYARGEPEDVTRHFLFLNPQSQNLQPESTDFNKELEAVLHSQYGEAAQKLMARLKELSVTQAVPTSVRAQIRNNRMLQWRYPNMAEAEIILKQLNAKDGKPYAMHKRDLDNRKQTAYILAESKLVRDTAAPISEDPNYRGTKLFTSPILPIYKEQ